jgi:hypothetical protein
VHCRARRRIGSRHLYCTTSSGQLHRRSTTATLAYSLIIGSSPFIWQNVYRPLHVTIRGKCEANGISTPQAFVEFTAVKLNLWRVRSSPNLAAISPGRQPIPRRLLNKKSEQNQQKIEKPGRGSEFPRSTRPTNPLHDGQPLSHGFTTHRLDARIFSQRAANWNRADRNYPLNMFAPGFPTAL